MLGQQSIASNERQIDDTIDASIVGLDIGLLDLSIVDHKSISLTSFVSKDRCAIESDIESFGELACGISQEANLQSTRS